MHPISDSPILGIGEKRGLSCLFGWYPFFGGFAETKAARIVMRLNCRTGSFTAGELRGV